MILRLKYSSQFLGRDRRLSLGYQYVALHAWLDDVKIGEVNPVQLISHIGEQRPRVAVRHAVPGSAWPDPHRDTAAPHTETIASTTSSRKRERLAIEPPYASVRRLLPSWRN
jgi:hypothetical protein